MQKTVVQMEIGECGFIVEVRGSAKMMRRLRALGIREGKRLIKLRSQILRGPITVRVNNSEVAISPGVAEKIVVEIRDEKNSSCRES
jgi:Fe2+ transport system protein FeoA